MFKIDIVRERVRGHAATERDEKRILGLRMQRRWQISEQAHVALITRIRRRHRKSVGHQPVVIRLTKQIAAQQLPGSGRAFDFFNQMLVFGFVQFSRISEMHFVAMIWKQRDACNKQNAQFQQRESSQPLRRPVIFLTDC